MNYEPNKHTMELSVIIVSFNVRDFLKQCLHSVNLASKNIDCEVFVVDNNSSDSSCEMVMDDFPGVILIRNKSNLGFAAANNQAIKQSGGRYILLLNPDTIVEPETFIKCINFMNRHPSGGALGVKMINGNGDFLRESKRGLPTPSATFFKIFGISYLFPDSRFFSRYYLTHINTSETSEAEIIAGAFMFIRKEAIDKSGLLDEDFFMYGEDIDLSYRLLQNGYKNYYLADTQIVHLKGKSTRRDSLEDIYYFYKAMRIYVDKRRKEGKLGMWKFLLVPAIYFREGLALFNRFVRISFLSNDKID